MEEFAIDRPPRAAAFLAQLAHESGQLRFMEEIWGPTPAQRRYEPPTRLAARLGNVQAGDGKRFKGRGPIQLTGRANYRVFGDALGLDLVADPALAASKEVAFRIAGLYWRKRGLNALADRQDFRRITKLINGGFNGLVDRLRFWERAKRIFDVRSLSAAAARRMRRLVPPDEAPDLTFHRGLDGGREPTPTAVERSAAALRGRAAARRAPAKKTRRKAPARKAPAKPARTAKAPVRKAATKAKPRPSTSKATTGRTRRAPRAAVRKKPAARPEKAAVAKRKRR
jgi:predicted chitinase